MTLAFKTAWVYGFLLLAAATADARVLKWVDEHGVTHYSEEMPAGQAAREIRSPSTPTPDNSGVGNPASQFMQQERLANFSRKAKLEEQEKAAAQREAGVRKAKCGQARQKLDILGRQARIYTVDKSGQRVFVDDDARAIEIQRVTKDANENCNP